MKQFSIILYFSFTFYTFHFTEGDDALTIPVDNNFTEKNIKTGNAFVKFFKYGKHSILLDEISGSTVGVIIDYLSKNIGSPFSYYIMELFASRYNFKSPIKNNIGYFVSLVFEGNTSHFDFISFIPSFNFLSLNLGIYYTILQKKSFSWDLHAGIGFSWRWTIFYDPINYSKNCRNFVNRRTKIYKSNQENMPPIDSLKIPKIEALDENESYLKHYFKSVNFWDNIKHFDILLDLSIFDFTIKNHFKISLSWHCGIAYMFYFSEREKIYKEVFNATWIGYGSLDVLMYLGLEPLIISIGYVF